MFVAPICKFLLENAKKQADEIIGQQADEIID